MAFCMMERHQSNEITCICTFKDCQQAYRQTCRNCITEQLHFHGYNSAPYLISIQQFEKQLDKLIYPWASKKCYQQIENIIQDLQLMLEWIKKMIECSKISQLCISQLDEMIHLYNISLDLPDQRQFINHLESVKIKLQFFQDAKYQPKDIEYELVPQNTFNYSRDCDHIIISQDEKYLGLRNKTQISDKDYKFEVISMPKIRPLYSINQKVGKLFVNFSKDSRFVILSSPKCIYIYQVKNLKILFKLNFEYYIFNVKWMNKTTVLIANNKVITVFDILQKKTILQIDETRFNMLDYDSQNDLIVASQGSDIKFFNRKNGKSIARFNLDYDIKKIQLSNQGQYLLIVYQNKITTFKVDLQGGRIQQLQSFTINFDQFSLCQYDSMIFTFIDGELKILNDLLQVRHIIKICSGSRLMQGSQNYIFLMVGDSSSVSVLKKTTHAKKNDDGDIFFD